MINPMFINLKLCSIAKIASASINDNEVIVEVEVSDLYQITVLL
jgi:hypothetical protein